MASLFENGSTCSFEVYAPAILGTGYTNVKVLGILTPSLAARLRPSIFEEHAAVLPYLPPGTPKKATGFDYIEIETQGGIKTTLGLAWINEASIVVSKNGSIDVKINSVSATDIAHIRNLLTQAGYNQLTLEFKAGIS